MGSVFQTVLSTSNASFEVSIHCSYLCFSVNPTKMGGDTPLLPKQSFQSCVYSGPGTTRCSGCTVAVTLCMGYIPFSVNLELKWVTLHEEVRIVFSGKSWKGKTAGSTAQQQCLGRSTQAATQNWQEGIPASLEEGPLRTSEVSVSFYRSQNDHRILQKE